VAGTQSRKQTASARNPIKFALDARRKGQVFGDDLSTLILIRCVCCQKWHVLRVDPQDFERHMAGVYVQFAFPYLSPGLRELLISRVCPDCWAFLCPSNPLAYS